MEYHDHVEGDRRHGDPHIDGKLIQLIDPLHNKYLVAYDLRGVGDSLTYTTKEYNHLPTHKEIIDLISGVYNLECDMEILDGYDYTTIEENPVTKRVSLSTENQFNWIIGYLLTKDLQSVNLPEFLKIGSDDDIYIYRIDTIEQYKHFIMSNLQHIKDCLQRCWQKKSNIDLSKYTL